MHTALCIPLYTQSFRQTISPHYHPPISLSNERHREITKKARAGDIKGQIGNDSTAEKFGAATTSLQRLEIKKEKRYGCKRKVALLL